MLLLCTLSSSTNEKALLVTYPVAYRIVETRELHITAEDLTLPVAVDVEIWIGEEEETKIKTNTPPQ